MDWNEFTRGLFRLAEPYLKIRGDLPHAQVSHRYALRLLEEEGGESRIVEPAVILHDVGWSELEPEQIKIAFGVRAGGRRPNGSTGYTNRPERLLPAGCCNP